MTQRQFEKLKFLLGGGNAHMVSIVKTILRGYGAKEIVDIGDPEKAFELFKATRFDIIIADFQIDSADPVILVRRVRTDEDSPNAFLPIILLTAYTERTNVEKARDAGVTEICVKPVTAADLYRKISVAVNSPRPFVRTRQYFGPDRRRRKGAPFLGEERRENPEAGDDADLLTNAP